MLPQEPVGLVLIVLRDHLPAAIPQQRHEQPTRRLAYPPGMHRGGHNVELLGLAPPYPAPGAGLLVQGQEAAHIAQIRQRHFTKGR